MVLQLFFGRRMGVLRIRAAKFAGLDKGTDRPGALVLVGFRPRWSTAVGRQDAADAPGAAQLYSLP